MSPILSCQRRSCSTSESRSRVYGDRAVESVDMRTRLDWIVGAAVLAVVFLASLEACQDGESPVGSVLETLSHTAHEPVVSDPQRSIAASGPATAARQGTASEVVYVSLPPGTVPTGGFATIRDARTGTDASAAMAEGGFDPVPLFAAVGDTLAINVRLAGGGTKVLRLVVPATRRPVVVRAYPPPRKRDVPLNTSIVAVFSEPVQSGSTIQLLKSGSPVSGTTVLSADGLRAEFRPAQQLSPNTDYVLAIPSNVADLTGDQIGNRVTTEFTTGTTIIAASVATDPVALFTNPFTQTVRTFEMRAIRDGADQVTGTFSIFFPQTGVRFPGRVTCFTIVGGDSVWVCGILDSAAASPEVAGKEAVWRAVDNGTPSVTVHDQLSLVDPGLGPGAGHDWCANTPLVFPEGDVAELIDVQSGNIVVNASGGPPPPPPPPPPAPPPDSNSMSQVAFFTAYEAILAINADGTTLRTVTLGPRDDNPMWSPDGRKIVFQSDRTQRNDWDIYVVNWDGSSLKRLTAGAATDQDPAWSPDGRRIAFLRDGSIHVMNADGTGVTRLSFTGFDSHPSWSPDGSRIVFASSRTGVNAIHVMDADGTNVIQLTGDSAIDYSPSWSLDGSAIAFQRNAPSGWPSIYVMNVDGSGLRRLGSGRTPAWSPDSRRIMYEEFSIESMLRAGAVIKWDWLFEGPDTVTVRASLSDHFVATNAAGVSSVQMRLGSGQQVLRVRAALLDGSARKGEVLFTETAVPKP